MAPSKDHETNNAEKWETDSTVSTASLARPLSSLINQQQWLPRGQGPPRPLTYQPSTERYDPRHTQGNQHHERQDSVRAQGFARPSPSNFHESNTLNTPPQPQATTPYQRGLNVGSSSGYPNTHAPYQRTGPTPSPSPHASQGQLHHRQGLGYDASSKVQTNRGSKSKWAKPQGLVTARKELINNENAAKEAEFQRLRTKPERNDEFISTGYYLCSDPTKIFDPDLKAFDHLRKTYKVHIDWNEKMRCLRINSISHPRVAEANVAEAIEGIKQKYLDAQAQVISASPIYIITPPTNGAIRSIVQPEKVEERADSSNPLIISIALAGERLSPAAQSKWEFTRRQMKEANYIAFRTHLFKSILELKNLRSWMRMRVQYGHINLSQYQKDFLDGKYSFELFAGMMKRSRVATGGTFDRRMDAAIAMDIIQRIVGREQDFCPRKSKTLTLSDVLDDPRHTEIIFLTTPDGQARRLEAEIESVQCGVMGKYQIGHTRLFEDDGRNKRAEITTVDIESKFDWSVEIIQDSETKDVPQTLREYIAASLNNRSTELVDPLELPYPAIALRKPVGFIVKNVVMRSVFQYQLKYTANVVEIAVYREWRSYDTRAAPAMQASVSMFNPDWDTEMDSIENTTLERRWDKQLHNFFGMEGVNHKTMGFSGLMAEIREVQRLLSDATEEEGATAKAAEEKDKQAEEEELERQYREIEEAEEAEEAATIKAVENQHKQEEEELERQIREIDEATEVEERRQQEITKKRATAEKTADKAATVYTPLATDPTFLSFNNTPAPDGSLI